MNSLELAINMELEGEKYYTQQAERNKNNGLDSVFLLLANDEKNHANILTNKSKDLPFELKQSNTLRESKGIFKEIFQGKNEIKESPTQLDVYKSALETEKGSIELYKELLAKAVEHKEKELFGYLIQQEEEHYKIIDEIIILLTKPEEWVESAEFGIRDDY